MKGRVRKEKKETAALSLDKEKKKPQPIKSEKPPVIVEKPNEEAIKNQPIIQELNLTVTALAEAVSGSFVEVNKKFQSYDVQAKDTNEKITALGDAISILNNEFSNFMKDLQAKLASAPVAPGADNTPPGTSILSSKRVDIEKPPVAEPPPPSTGDKIMQYLNVLAALAGSGQPSNEGGGGMAGASSLLELVLKLQDNAEERALKRTESSIKNIAAIANLLMGKKVELPIEAAKVETKEHL